MSQWPAVSSLALNLLRRGLPGGLCILLVGGCAARPAAPAAPADAPAAGPASPYLTVGPEPRRDTSAAARGNELALSLMAKSDYAGAEAALKQALVADVMFGPAHNNLGMVYYRQSRLYLAAWEFQYAIKLMPNQPEPKNNLGLVFETSGKLDQAVESFGAAMKLEPDNPQFLGNLARARVRRGDGGDDVRGLLEKVVADDGRREWVEWARERLALFKRTRPAPPGSHDPRDTAEPPDSSAPDAPSRPAPSETALPRPRTGRWDAPAEGE